MKNHYLPALAMSMALLGGNANAESPRSDLTNRENLKKDHPSYQSDNTGVNERDRQNQRFTADQQSNEARPLEVTKKIRQAIVERDDLSSYAHNVKIVTNDTGNVTLRGPVRTAQERTAIGQIAMDIAGQAQVRNELEVAPERKDS